MKKLVPEYIENAKLYPPGRPLEEIRRLYGLEEIVKLNANENCLGPSPRAVEAVVASARGIHRYPDNSAHLLKDRLAQQFGVGPEQILLGNGSNELVQFIMMTFLLPGEEVLTARPTFLLYGIMGQVFGGTVREVPLKDFALDLESMQRHITPATKLVFISNPNNPTGTIVTGRALAAFMEAVPDDVIVVIDEAYAEYVTSSDFADSRAYVASGRNLILLRTFSKAYGLAGLRLGYALAPSAIISYLERTREPFNANALAQQAALAALDDHEHLDMTRANNAQGLAFLYQEFNKLGLTCVPSQTNFILARIGPAAERVCQLLLEQGVMVRPMGSFGLSEHIRVTVGLPGENRQLIETLEKVLRACSHPASGRSVPGASGV